MKRKLLALIDRLRADLAEAAAAIESEDIETASERLDDFRERCDAAVKELRA